MVSTQSGISQGPTPARRTEGGRTRRQALADAASGYVPAGVRKVERFRVVIYLCGPPGSDLTEPHRRCAEYAETFGWEVAATIEDRRGPRSAQEREGLRRAVELIEMKQAEAVLAPGRSMIATTPQEYDEIAHDVEKAGGFLHATCSDGA